MVLHCETVWSVGVFNFWNIHFIIEVLLACSNSSCKRRQRVSRPSGDKQYGLVPYGMSPSGYKDVTD